MTDTAPTAARAAIWLQNLLDERDGIALYEGLAAVDRNRARAETLAGLAEAEKKHAHVWEQKLVGAGLGIPAARASARVRLLLVLAKCFGVKAVLPWVVLGESADIDKYRRQGGASATALASDEQDHLETLKRLSDGQAAAPQPARPEAREAIFTRERWHRAGRSGAIRAAVFGMNDGVVSNVALVLGVAAAGADAGTLVITGLAGLLAGAFSMAVGEYVSVASQRDLLNRQVDLERRELAEAPEEEEAELHALLRQKGLSSAQAVELARNIMKDPKQALDTLVREELGLDPADLGSPISAALASFVTFAVGAAIPVVPFLLTQGTTASILSGALSAVVLGSVGGFLGVLSGTGAVRSAARMVGLAAFAAAVTVAVGRLIGVNIS